MKIKLLEFFEREAGKKKRTVFPAVITDVRRNGLFIELTESMTFGFISADALSEDHYLLNNAGNALVGRRKHKRYDLGSKLTVVVDRVDRFKRLIDFAGRDPNPIPGIGILRLVGRLACRHETLRLHPEIQGAVRPGAQALRARASAGPETYFSVEEAAWLAANGLTPQHLYDYAEDQHNYGRAGP